LFAVRFSDRLVRIPRRAVATFTGQSYVEALADTMRDPGDLVEQTQAIRGEIPYVQRRVLPPLGDFIVIPRW